MCDTFVAPPSITATGNLIFGKNSDREPNEAQAIIRLPKLATTSNKLRCTFIEIPQVKETNEVILSKPFQMWGAEMGVNEHGLVIGNEALFTKVSFNKRNEGLTGMDLLRLALERCKTATHALETITELLAEYGQDACGGYENRNFFYHNGFLIADAQEAWVLETAGKAWAAEKVRGFRSISNGISIGSEYDLSSKNLVTFAQQKSWIKRGETFNFAKHYSEPIKTRFSACKIRQALTTELGKQYGKLTAAEAMAILSTHDQAFNAFEPHKTTTASVCMHHTGLLNPSQTTGSMVAEIRSKSPSTVWLIGTSSPCLSVFKPVFVGGKFLTDFPLPTAHADASLWWQAERLHRLANWNYAAIQAIMKEERLVLQQELLEKEAMRVRNQASLVALDEFSGEAFARHSNELQRWLAKTEAAHIKADFFDPLYKLYWQRLNRRVRV